MPLLCFSSCFFCRPSSTPSTTSLPPCSALGASPRLRFSAIFASPASHAPKPLEHRLPPAPPPRGRRSAQASKHSPQLPSVPPCRFTAATAHRINACTLDQEKAPRDSFRGILCCPGFVLSSLDHRRRRRHTARSRLPSCQSFHNRLACTSSPSPRQCFASSIPSRHPPFSSALGLFSCWLCVCLPARRRQSLPTRPSSTRHPPGTHLPHPHISVLIATTKRRFITPQPWPNSCEPRSLARLSRSLPGKAHFTHALPAPPAKPPHPSLNPPLPALTPLPGIPISSPSAWELSASSGMSALASAPVPRRLPRPLVC